TDEIKHRLDSIISKAKIKLSDNSPNSTSSKPKFPALSEPLYKCKRDGNLIYYDAEWQFPAITEQHAFMQVSRQRFTSNNLVYFGFPWATLFDLLNGRKADAN